ncbi:MAG: hypothetical protein K6B14_02925 [Lachnospiraceae bacterium]|nr:hypothetical protein [Lachnospiraceae bacterium]
MSENVKERLMRVIILLVGLTVAHFGVTLFLLSELGSDPFNVFIQGLFRTGSGVLPILTHGRVHIAISLIIMVILIFVDKTYVKIGTILCMICGGPIIDFFSMVLSPLSISERSMVVRLPILAAGCVILAYGMTIVIKSDAGTGPNDLVAVVISDKLGRRFSIVRIIVDFSFVIIGWALGGTVGIGTIICAFLVGPVAGVFLPVNEKLIGRILRKCQ